MKKSMKALMLMLVILMLSSAAFVQVYSFNDEADNYVFVVEEDCAETSLKRISTVNRFTIYSDKAYSGRYGDQLTGNAKKVYDALVKRYVTNGRTDKFTYTFKTPFVFDAEVVMGTLMTNDAYTNVKNQIRNALQMAQDAFLYDYPELFWLRYFSWTYNITTEKDKSGNYKGKIDSIIIMTNETYYGASGDISSFQSAINRVLSSVNVTDNRYETLKSIHDYICQNTWYYLNGGDVIYTSAPFFIGNGGMVCEGYAEAFKILCDRLGIPCALIVGDAGGPHMWNYVQMEDGKWYLVDATWDDDDREISYTYFIANANTIGYDRVAIRYERTPTGDFSETGVMCFNYPVFAETEYVPHTHQWNSTYTIDKNPTCTQSGSKSIHCVSCSQKKNVTTIPAKNHISRMNFDKQSATCSTEGFTAGVYCYDCNTWISGHKSTGYAAHSYIVDKIKATLEEDGDIIRTCTVCDYIKISTVYRPKTIRLSETSYTYNGKTKTPEVIVEDRKGNMLDIDVDYKITYSKGRTQAGKYTVRVDFMGDYSGSKRLYFTIAPKVTSKVTFVQSTKAIKLKWNKVTGADGYRVYQYNAKTKKWDNIKTLTGTSYKAENLKAGTTYKFRIKAYTKSGSTIWGAATKTITVATKPSTPKITKITTTKGKAAFTWSDVSGESGYQVYYSTKKDEGFKKVKTYGADVVKGTKSKLTGGKTYYFKVRAYKVVGDTKVYSAWSPVKSVKIK